MKELIKNVLEEVIKWRRDLHQIPEVGQYLPQTSEYVCKQLETMGISYKKGVGIECAIVATIEGTKEGKGKTIALRADMDANPVKEETNLPFASKNGSMHSCGHDAHTAILLGVVKILNQMKEQFSGKIVFLFQPAEEISAGAKPMIDGGCLEGVESIIGMHVGNIASDTPSGTAVFSKGSMMACLDKWTMTVHGVGAHGAFPHASHDPVIMATHIIASIQEIVSRELNPVDPGVVTVGIINGGTSYNVIPGSVYLEGTARAVNQNTREFIAKRIGEIAESVAKAFRGSIEYNYIFGAPPLVNDEEFTLKVMESVKKAIGEDNVQLMDKPVMGGEDFSYYLEKVPGTFIFLSNPLEIDGVCYPHHNSKFAIDEQYFDRGITIFVQATLDLLTN
jgi:amidohydrolase